MILSRIPQKYHQENMREYQLSPSPLSAPRHREQQGKYPIALLFFLSQIVDLAGIIPVHCSVHQCVQATLTVMPTSMKHHNATKPMHLP